VSQANAIPQATLTPAVTPGLAQVERFVFSLPGSSTSAADVLQLWQPGGPVSWQTENIGTFWRAELPGDANQAFLLLDQRDQDLRLCQQALPAADAQLTSDLRALQPGPGGVFFSLAQEEPGSPRSFLAAGLQHQGAGVSFGLFDNIKIDPLQLNAVAKTASGFAEQVSRAVDQLALVETTSDGHRLGLTRAAWGGDVETWWASGATYDQCLQHQQVLAQALATRQAWLRFLLSAAAGITRVAAAIAAGPFSPIAIWTTWNYLQATIKNFNK
jgi:hypothetical protein